MDNLHKSECRPWISSKINLRKFRDDWFKCLTIPKSSTKLKFKMSEVEFSKLEEECGVAAMKCPAQDYVEISKNFTIPDGVDLETLRLQKEDIDKRSTDPQYEALIYCHGKSCNYPPYRDFNLSTTIPDDAHFESVQESEVVLVVQVFRPERRSNIYLKPSQIRFPNFQVDQEFMVLGCQHLTELRDKIDCVSDRAIPGDCSDMPEFDPEVTCKDLYKSGFFYIDGVFYNDMRDPDCRDYSKVIISWAENRSGIGPFQKALMEKIKFIDLEIQLGYPYVYVHQGNCEHLIVFSDLQFFTHHYSNNRLEYPIPAVLKPKKRMLCMICRIHTAEWIVFDNKRVPENPFYFCKQCFFSFNYDENNQKIGSFKAYHHIDRSSIV